MSPNNDGKMIRLTGAGRCRGEQRQKMVARIKKSAEEAKVACRNIRRDANKHFDQAEKDKEMTEDERDKGKERSRTLLKTFEDKISEMADKKSQGSDGTVAGDTVDSVVPKVPVRSHASKLRWLFHVPSVFRQ